MDLSAAIDQLMHEAEVEALPAWTGIPLTQFTSAYATPEQLYAAEERRQLEGIRERHTWRSALCGGQMKLEHHTLDTFSVDLRCGWFSDHPENRGVGVAERVACTCVGDLTYMAVCGVCDWHSIGTENASIEAWHDHAFPGWRDLPILPKKLRGQMGTGKMTPKLDAWFTSNYPAHFRVPGAPIRTTRDKYATRHVPGYSPFGGYDLSDN